MTPTWPKDTSAYGLADAIPAPPRALAQPTGLVQPPRPALHARPVPAPAAAGRHLQRHRPRPAGLPGPRRQADPLPRLGRPGHLTVVHARLLRGRRPRDGRLHRHAVLLAPVHDPRALPLPAAGRIPWEIRPPHVDLMDSLVDWVQNGKAPGTLTFPVTSQSTGTPTSRSPSTRSTRSHPRRATTASTAATATCSSATSIAPAASSGASSAAAGSCARTPPRVGPHGRPGESPRAELASRHRRTAATVASSSAAGERHRVLFACRARRWGDLVRPGSARWPRRRTVRGPARCVPSRARSGGWSAASAGRRSARPRSGWSDRTCCPRRGSGWPSAGERAHVAVAVKALPLGAEAAGPPGE